VRSDPAFDAIRASADFVAWMKRHAGEDGGTPDAGRRVIFS
jgi:hypothetical protein